MVNGGVEFPQLSYTPLHLATWTINKAAIKTVSELLQFDVDVNVKDKVSLHTLTHSTLSSQIFGKQTAGIHVQKQLVQATSNYNI